MPQTTLEEFLADWRSASPTLTVHTSGSTGAPKPLRVEKRRMEASARMTCRFLGLRPGDTALLCLPLRYIAGKMVVVRALTCGLRLVEVEPSSHPLATLAEAPAFAAMVPLQVYETLRVPRERELLRRVRHLIIGGGAVSEGLERELRTFPHAVWSTYGMTETLSHIALRRLSGPGASPWYAPFEGVAVALGPDGCLAIDAPAVCAAPLHTNDCAVMHPDGRRFRITGRKDNTICSGGVKIQAEEAERLLAPHLAKPCLYTHRPDPRLGQAAVLLTEDADTEAVALACRQALPRLWQPRHIVHVERLPLTETGKPARKRAEEMAAQPAPSH